MKRMISFFVVLTSAALFWGGSQATLQTEDKAERANLEASTTDNIFGKGPKHKLFISEEDLSLYNELADRNAITREVDYGSFKMVVVEEQALGGKSALMNFRDQVRDDQDLIALNGYILDTTNGQLTLNKVPANLRQTDMSDALAGASSSPAGGLYIVQFVGPIKDEWLEQLSVTGVETVTYIPNNAYVVRADNTQASILSNFRNEDFVQFVGDYEPAFRLSPVLQAVRAEGSSGEERLIDITVQVIEGATAESTIQQLKDIGVEFFSEHKVLNYHNVTLKISASRLGEIASIDNVFAVEEYGELRLLDEAQGQILANQFSTFDNDEFPTPVGPFYLNFLASKGFNSSQFGGFAVNIVDDANTLTGASGHPDLPFSRVSFENNPANKNDAQGGHGFLNSHIIGGFNNGTGFPFEDADGHNYGLGIAPWARVGVTAIIGPNGNNIHPTDWESKAYDQGARISSNSWGKVNILGAPVTKYNANAQEYDRIVRDARSANTGNQQLIVVFAAGNAGPGSNTVGTPSTAKNVITVGASENIRPTGIDGCGVGVAGSNSSHDVADFSSRGPVNPSGGDGRIKPDIVAPGTHILAGVPQSNYNGSSVCDQYVPGGQTLYGWSSGTSHSCPAVSGGAALLFQYFINKSLGVPSPAMAKAYLMNSALYLTGSGAGGNLPSNSQGMGRMDLKRAFDETKRILVDQKQILGASGNFQKFTGVVSDPSKPFRVTLAWTDAPGPTTGAPFVNNLDLEVTINGTTYKGNVFSGANSTSGGSFDPRNNVESIFLPAGVSGPFTITVKATNIAGDGVPGNSDTTDQDFALVVYNSEATNSTFNTFPSSLNFTATAGAANPATQQLIITNSNGLLNFNASDNATWLSVTPAIATAPWTATVSVNVSGLAAGTYNGTITISGLGANTKQVPVTLTLNAPPPAISINPTSLSFTAVEPGPNPSSQSLNITNSGGGTLNWTASDNASWLGISPQSGTAPSTAVVVANISGLAAGIYNGTITISAPGATNSPVSVPVTLTVTQAPEISVSPASLNFAAYYGQASANKLLNVTNSGGNILLWSATEDANWLTVNPSAGSAPSGETNTVSVSVNTSGLAIGTYTHTITIKSPFATEIRYVPVTLTITRPPIIGVDQASLRFAATAGGASPANKLLNITNAGGDLLKWTAIDDASWLSVNPTSGTAPSAATISVNIAGLAVGTYSGTITINAPGAATRQVIVELTVNPPVQ